MPPLPLELGLPLAGTAPCFAVGHMSALDAEGSALYSLTYTAEEKQCAHVVVRFSHYKISYKHMMTCVFSIFKGMRKWGIHKLKQPI